MRMEQLCYPNPLPNVLAALSDITGVSEQDLRKQYHAAVKHNRAETALKYFFDHQFIDQFTSYMVSAASEPIDKHPFVVWREHIMRHHNDKAGRVGESLSQIKFSSLVSVHPATLNKYETFDSGFPGALNDALTEMLLPDHSLKLLNTHPIFNQIVR